MVPSGDPDTESRPAGEVAALEQSAAEATPDPMAMLRSKQYVSALILAAIIGVPVSAAAYVFLRFTVAAQHDVFEALPHSLGFTGTPAWWPLPFLVLAGLLTGLCIRCLPGTGGHRPADGFQAGGPPTPAELPGIILAALASLSLGVVLGPEAPLIALGGGLAVLAVRLAKPDAPPSAALVLASAGSFAAISALFGSPLLGAFLLMEVSGLGGPMIGVILAPGLLAAGIGSLVFIGLGSLTGVGTISFSVPDLPAFAHPDVAMFGWAVAFGLVAPLLGTAIRLVSQRLQQIVEPRSVLATPVAGAVVGLIVLAYGAATHKSPLDVLFSGEDALPNIISHRSAYAVGLLVVLALFKTLAYMVSLSSFRGGPIFPAIFIGGVLGLAAGHLPGLSITPGVAMGIGVMCTVMLRLPLSSTLLATLLIGHNGITVMPLVIVAVVVSYVAVAWLPQRWNVARRGAGSSPSERVSP